MRIETINEIFTEAISKASKIAVKNPQNPILEYIHIELIDASTLQISGYNLDTYITQAIFVKLQENFTKKISLCVQGGLVLSFLSLFSKDDSISIELTDSNLKLIIQNQESNIRCVSATDFPKTPVYNKNDTDAAQVLKLSSEVIIEGVQAVSFASAITSIKPELSCILMSLHDESIVFVATDGFRLAEKKIAVKGVDVDKNNLDAFKQVLIPSKIWQDCLKVLPSHISISVVVEKGLCFIEYPEGFIVLRTISGSYPNYKAILPQTFVTQVDIQTQDFLQGLKVSHIFSDEFNYVKLDIEENKLILSSKNSKVGESFSRKDIFKKGDSISQSYNHRYLSDFVSKVKGDTVIFNISGKSTPSILKVKGDDSYTYMVMPMNK